MQIEQSDTTSKAMYKAQADDFKDRMDAIVDSFSNVQEYFWCKQCLQ